MTTLTSSPMVFLVSGGARGITAQCVIQLAKVIPSRWILLGRSEKLATEPDWAQDCEDDAELKRRILHHLTAAGEKPTPMQINRQYRSLKASREIVATLQTLESLGAEAAYLSADVTDAATLQTQLVPLVDKFGPITGIIHGAGNLADKFIDQKTEQDFERVYGPKIDGLANLLSCIPVSQLQHLVLFSSVSGFYGNAGQADYALANEILNKVAWQLKRYQPNCRTVAINWGPWESGMVTPQLKKAFADRGVLILPVADATKMLVNELSQRHQTSAQVVVGSPLPPRLAVIDGGLKTHRMRRRLTLEANPFLHDHMISGSAVLPFTCSMNWVANAGEQLYPGYSCFLCEDVRVLKGVVFNQTLPDEFVLDFKELAKSEDEIVLDGKIWSQTDTGKIRYHYCNRITLRREIPDSPVLKTIDMSVDNAIAETNFYQTDELSLFHGPAFRGITQILNMSPSHITVECVAEDIGAQKQGQFPVRNLNPYIADLQAHAAWVWLRYFHQSVCLPAKVGRFANYSNPPYGEPFYASAQVVSKTGTGAVFDITIHDKHGKAYTVVTGIGTTIFPLITKTA